MRFFTHRIVIAVLIALAFASKARANDLFYDAMALAIEHHNADHGSDLRAWGAEHQQMLAALAAVEREVPAVKGLRRLGYVSQGFGNDPFRVLSRELYVSKNNIAERIEAERLEAHVADLVAGCPFERTTTIDETDFGYTQPSTQTRVRARYRLESSASKKCTNPLTQDLVRAGINGITFEKAQAAYGDTMTVIFSQESNLYRDMAFVKNNLLKIEALRDLVTELEVIDFDAAVIGKSSDVRVVETTGSASLTDKVRLRYWKGWGDCPAGCISGHEWLIEVTPLAGGTFKVELILESGAPLIGDEF